MDSVFRFFCLTAYFGGLIWIAGLLSESYFRKQTRRLRYRIRQRIAEMQPYRTNRFIEHLDRMLYLTARHYQPGISSIRFLLRSFYLFLTVLVSLGLVGDVPRLTYENPFLQTEVSETTQLSGTLIVSVALVAGLMPYVVLRFRYHRNLIKGSYDLAEVIKILSRHAHLPVSFALRHTADSLPASNVLKRPVLILASAFSSYGSLRELKAETQRFARAIGTTFATQLAMDLLYAETEGGKNLKRSLLFLNQAIENQRQTILKAKDEARDAIALGLWVNLFVIVITSAVAVQFLTLRVFLKLLLQTNAGLSLFLVVLVSLIVSFLVSRVLARPKLDY